MVNRPVEITPETIAAQMAAGYRLGLWSKYGRFPELIAWLHGDVKGKTVKHVQTWTRSYTTGAWRFAPDYNTQIPKDEIRCFDADAYNTLVQAAQKLYDLEQTIKGQIEALVLVSWEAGARNKGE